MGRVPVIGETRRRRRIALLSMVKMYAGERRTRALPGVRRLIRAGLSPLTGCALPVAPVSPRGARDTLRANGTVGAVTIMDPTMLVHMNNAHRRDLEREAAHDRLVRIVEYRPTLGPRTRRAPNRMVDEVQRNLAHTLQRVRWARTKGKGLENTTAPSPREGRYEGAMSQDRHDDGREHGASRLGPRTVKPRGRWPRTQGA